MCYTDLQIKTINKCVTLRICFMWNGKPIPLTSTMLHARCSCSHLIYRHRHWRCIRISSLCSVFSSTILPIVCSNTMRVVKRKRTTSTVKSEMKCKELRIGVEVQSKAKQSKTEPNRIRDHEVQIHYMLYRVSTYTRIFTERTNKLLYWIRAVSNCIKESRENAQRQMDVWHWQLWWQLFFSIR